MSNLQGTAINRLAGPVINVADTYESGVSQRRAEADWELWSTIDALVAEAKAAGQDTLNIYRTVAMLEFGCLSMAASTEWQGSLNN
jgi:hypothetical protein